MNAAVSYAGALTAGLLSFLSPCILPLVPAYLAFLSGVSYEEMAGPDAPSAPSRRVLVAACAFALGFITVFVLLGASATLLSRLIADHLSLLEKISGALVVVFGLHYTGLVRVPILDREARFHPTLRAAGPLGAFAVGLAFAFGWTPCVGPVLATILAVAGSSLSITHGMLLLGAYGLGIGIPFIVAALALRPFLKAAAHVRRRSRVIEVTLGLMMMLTGGLIFVGSLAQVSGWLMRAFPGFARFG